MDDLFKYPSIDPFDLITALKKAGMDWKQIAGLGFTYKVEKQFTPGELQEWYAEKELLKKSAKKLRL